MKPRVLIALAACVGALVLSAGAPATAAAAQRCGNAHPGGGMIVKNIRAVTYRGASLGCRRARRIAVRYTRAWLAAIRDTRSLSDWYSGLWSCYPGGRWGTTITCHYGPPRRYLVRFEQLANA